MRQVKWFRCFLIGMITTLVFSLTTATPLAQDTHDAGLQLEETAICRQVQDRVPIGRGSVFPVSIERLYCFTKVVGANADTSIIHHWYLNGKLKDLGALPVKSAAWRTWSSKNISFR